MQTNIVDAEIANISLGLNQANLIDVELNEVELFDSTSASQMAEY